jgi:hypothetical protein
MNAERRRALRSRLMCKLRRAAGRPTTADATTIVLRPAMAAGMQSRNGKVL